MKKIFAILTFTLFHVASQEINAGSPKQCRETLRQVGKDLRFDRPFWELSIQEIDQFKSAAKKAGLWSQFAQICNAWPADKCKSCKCGRDFSDEDCSPNCACCWGNESCASNAKHKMSDKSG